MSQEYQFADDDNLKKRQRQLSEFLDRMFDEEDRPYFVSDEACLYDVNWRLKQYHPLALQTVPFIG